MIGRSLVVLAALGLGTGSAAAQTPEDVERLVQSSLAGRSVPFQYRAANSLDRAHPVNVDLQGTFAGAGRWHGTLSTSVWGADRRAEVLANDRRAAIRRLPPAEGEVAAWEVFDRARSAAKEPLFAAFPMPEEFLRDLPSLAGRYEPAGSQGAGESSVVNGFRGTIDARRLTDLAKVLGFSTGKGESIERTRGEVLLWIDRDRERAARVELVVEIAVKIETKDAPAGAANPAGGMQFSATRMGAAGDSGRAGAAMTPAKRSEVETRSFSIVLVLDQRAPAGPPFVPDPRAASLVGW